MATPTEALVAYLTACGGRDRTEFVDDSGQPDPAAARRFAQKLRAQLGPNLSVVAEVAQRVNVVEVILVAEPAAV